MNGDFNPDKKRRRPHTRTSKACDLCRQQKTRCLRDDSSIACLRCTTMSLQCSLLQDEQPLSHQQFQLPSINNNIQNTIYDRLPPTTYPSRNHSLSHSPIPIRASDPMPLLSYTPPISSIDVTKLDQINTNVKTILNILSNPSTTTNILPNSSEHSNSVPKTISILQNSLPNNTIADTNDLLPLCKDTVNFTNLPTQSNSISPIKFLNSVSETFSTPAKPKVNLPFSIQQQLYPLHLFKPKFEDIITSEILSMDQTIQLINIFRDRYGRWLSFPSLKSTPKLIKRLRQRCPLLLTISCLLSLKYGDPLLKQKIWPRLLSIVSREVHWLNSSYSCGLEELQCLVILGAYSIILSDSTSSDKAPPNLLLDGWNLSGIGLTIFEKINGFGLLDQMYGTYAEKLWKENKLKVQESLNNNDNEYGLYGDGAMDTPNIPIYHNQYTRHGYPTFQTADDNVIRNGIGNHYNENNENDGDEVEEEDEEEDTDEFNLLTIHRIWNTMVLIQLAYCLLYGRKSWISIDKLKPREVSNIASATNFDFRIIAEIHIYLIGYRYMILNDSYSDAIRGIKFWLDKWNCTFGQPSNQFVEIDYHFVEILIKLKHSKIDLNSICSSLNNSSDTNLKLDVVDSLNLNDLDNLKTHSLSIVNLINTVNDDSYFAFLSDQIHLTVFFATNVLISSLSILNYLKENIDSTNSSQLDSIKFDKSVLKNFQLSNDILKKVESLIFRFRTVATTKNDTFYRYYSILERNYNNNIARSV